MVTNPRENPPAPAFREELADAIRATVTGRPDGSLRRTVLWLAVLLGLVLSGMTSQNPIPAIVGIIAFGLLEA